MEEESAVLHLQDLPVTMEWALQPQYVVGSAAAGAHAREWPSVLVHYEAHMMELQTDQPLVGRFDEEPEEIVARWVAVFQGFAPSACVVAGAEDLALAQEEVLVTPPPELGSAEGAERQREEHVWHTHLRAAVLEAVAVVPGPESGQVQVIGLVVEHGPDRLGSWPEPVVTRERTVLSSGVAQVLAVARDVVWLDASTAVSVVAVPAAAPVAEASAAAPASAHVADAFVAVHAVALAAAVMAVVPPVVAEAVAQAGSGEGQVVHAEVGETHMVTEPGHSIEIGSGVVHLAVPEARLIVSVVGIGPEPVDVGIAEETDLVDIRAPISAVQER